MPKIGRLVAASVLGGLLSGAGIAQNPVAAPSDSSCSSVDSAECEKLARTVPVSPNSQEATKTTGTTAQPAAPTTSTPPVSASAAATPAPNTLEIPAGTKVLLTIRSAINTKTAQAGDGVYLQSSFPVIANGRAVIPAGVYVQGVVDSVERHIRIKGPTKMTMHFTSIIFPNGTVVEIPGLVNSLPGSDGPKVKGDEGTVQQSSSVGDVAKAAGKGAAVGAGVGSIGGAVNGDPLQGVGIGAGAGAAVGALVSLFTHGNDISIPSGTPIEMVLQRPLMLQESNLGGQDVTGEYLPAANQKTPMQKPTRTPMTCPPGSLGCS